MIGADPGDVWVWTNDPDAEEVIDAAYRFRGNEMNRRRYSGLFALLLALFT